MYDPRIPRLVCVYVLSKTHGFNGQTVLSKPRLNTLTFALFPQKFDPRLIIMFSRSGWTCSGCTTPKLAGLPPDVASVPEPNTMGYGFDDGPNCSHNAFYDFLSTLKPESEGDLFLHWEQCDGLAVASSACDCGWARNLCA